MLDTKFIKIQSENYGEVIAFYNPIRDFLCDGYIIRAIKRGKRLTGYIDIYKNLIIDLDNMSFDKYKYKEDTKDLCINFVTPEFNDVVYHLRNDDGYKLINKFDKKCMMQVVTFDHIDSHWLFVYGENNYKYEIYNINRGRVVTDLLDKIECPKLNDIHKFYFEKKLYANFEGKKMYVTTLCGYLDKDCMLSSNILDEEAGINAYPAYLYKSTTSKKYFGLCSNLIANHVYEYLDKKKNIGKLIDHMYYHPVIYAKTYDTPIYQFRRKND